MFPFPLVYLKIDFLARLWMDIYIYIHYQEAEFVRNVPQLLGESYLKAQSEYVSAAGGHRLVRLYK